MGSWYRESDIEYDGCSKTECRVKNLDDQTRIFFIEDDFRGMPVQIALGDPKLFKVL